MEKANLLTLSLFAVQISSSLPLSHAASSAPHSPSPANNNGSKDPLGPLVATTTVDIHILKQVGDTCKRRIRDSSFQHWL